MDGLLHPLAGVNTVPRGLLKRLRALAVSGLRRMYRPEAGLFTFRVRKTGGGLALEGVSVRYTAISLIGLSGEPELVQLYVLGGRTAAEVVHRIVNDAATITNPGDLAVALWAAAAANVPGRDAVARHLLAFDLDRAEHATVELSWALAALSIDPDAPAPWLRDRLAHRLIAAFDPRSGTFPHRIGAVRGGVRAHVCCFADLVYPVHALASYAAVAGDVRARSIAVQAARTLCLRQGRDGQWWWHYDRRTGEVIERYPVYAVHQDAMAPMALAAVEQLGADVRGAIASGLGWLAHAPELGGRSLIDDEAGVIWRKVARREPRKVSRYVNAAASALHPRLRIPAIDAVFPAGAVDYEDRPYHLGWLLHAWPRARVELFDAAETT